MTDKIDHELIDARAKALYEAIGINSWDETGEHNREFARTQARATFKADRAAGYKSLKREPTAVVRAAISKASRPRYKKAVI